MQFIEFETAKRLYESNYKGFWRTKDDAIETLKKGRLRINGHPYYQYLCWHLFYGFYLA